MLGKLIDISKPNYLRKLMISTFLKKLKDNEKDLIFLGLINSTFFLEEIVFNGNSEMGK